MENSQKKYYNYHKHDMYGNPISLDVVVKLEDYCKRAIELGHDAFFTTCHGLQGNLFEATTLAHKYELKMIVGAELYYVPDRLALDEEGHKDKSNRHIILIAKNHEGIRELNDIISESFISGMYYKPRIDHELLFSLTPENFIVTTACVAGLWDDEELIVELKEHFGFNLYLEVQNHNEKIQIDANKKIIRLSRKYGIDIIHANDSHYILPEDSKYRDLFLKAKGIIYPDENNFILDYPDYNTIVNRYKVQGVLNNRQIEQALENTKVFEEIDCSDYINDDIKLPSVSDTPNEELKNILNNAWKEKRKNIPKEDWPKYLEAIRYEMDIIEKTNMSNYFLIDYNIVKIAREKYGGVLTKTGRGCFTGEALIHTLSGMKMLKDVQIGDYVISEDGKYHKVLNTFKYSINEPMVKIKHQSEKNENYPSICTLDHKILVYSNGKRKWKEAKDIILGDYICVPKNVFISNEKFLSDKKYIYLAINNVEKIDIGLFDVYDLEIENVHSYLINNMIVHNSAPSFYTINLLDLTNIDRLKSPITLFPTRFMSIERILGTRSLPDIDLNSADAEPFIKASGDLLGEENCSWMLSWKPLQESSGFRLYCKAIGLNIDEYNDIAKDLDKYKEDKKWKPIIEESKHFVGVVEGISESPCSICLGTNSLRREIGLIKTPNGKICCLLDGYNCDKYKYLKNDYLTTTVWAIIRDTCKLVDIPIPSIKELEQLLDEKTFEIYAKGLTCTINQADSDYATGLVMRYKPKTLAEMSAFVAIIRPGCASLLEDFLDRKEYTTGIEQLDNILEDSQHRMIYQESIMKYLIWLGIPETGSYDIIKKIAKKKFKEDELKELKEKLLIGWKKQVGKEEGFEETWKIVEDASKYSFNCISGNTKIQRLGQKINSFHPTIEEMYKIKNDLDYAIKVGHKELHQKYKKYGYGNAYSMFDDNRIHKNKIVDIYYTGIQKIYRVKTKSGAYVDCTMNHKFPTPNGEKKLKDLKIGSKLYVKGTYEKHPDEYRFTNGIFESNIPKKNQKGFQIMENGECHKFMKVYKDKIKNKCPCELCERKYDNSKFELHHINHDRTNNERENLMWLCNSCHKKQHYKDGRVKVMEKGIPTIIDEIEDIVFLKEDNVYDIEMEAPAHNFISESGLVVSNCSHSLSYAYDSLYGAYLKSHYPLEYYTVVFNYYGNDSERTTKLTKELKYFGISLEKPKFRYSKANYFMDKETNKIYKGTGAIKFLNEGASNYLYSLKDEQFDTFVDLLVKIDQDKQINSRQMEILIKIQYFEEFGNNGTLLETYQRFNDLYGRKTFAKEKLSLYGLKHNDIEGFYEKETEKMYSGIDSIGLLKKIESQMPDNIIPLKEQIEFETEVVGYLSAIYDIDKGYCYVMDLDKKFSPKVKLYSLGSGKEIECKITKVVFNKQEFKKGAFIYCQKFTQKPKQRKTDKGWEATNEMEWWLNSYEIIENIEEVLKCKN